MLLQSLLRPVLTPLMRGMFDAPIFSSAPWSPLALWPDGISSAGMWISPRDLASQWADYTGTTPVATPGTVADASNPVGLALDIRAGATVLTDPGLHMLQSTSPARPLLSARVNLLTKTEDFSDAVWVALGATASANTATAPDGTTTANTMSEGTNDSRHTLYIHNFLVISGVVMTFSLYVKYVDRRYFVLGFDAIGVARVFFDLVDGVITQEVASVGAIESVGGGWYRVSITITTTSVSSYPQFSMSDRASSSPPLEFGTPVYTGENKTVLIWGAQLNLGSTALPYQRVNTDSDYDATGFPIAQKYDGVDDGMATAAFSAGTLISGVDCMIPVRRDSAASCVAGLYNGIADATKFFGMAESASGSGCVGSGAGTPTVWVDNTQLTGGTAVTRGTLHTALTVGDWHILEFRNLDLSTWTAAGFGLYTSYLFPGPRGDILLYPSTASTEDKDAARQWLADYYGVTLS